jgi:hypothetical protein
MNLSNIRNAAYGSEKDFHPGADIRVQYYEANYDPEWDAVIDSKYVQGKIDQS